MPISAPLLAQSPATEPSPRARLEEFARLEQQLVVLFGQKEYEKAADVCRRQMDLMPESGEPHYNLACALARLGQKDSALLEVGKAVELGFKDVAQMRDDADLASLRDDPKFKDLLKTVRAQELNAPHEKAADIAGVKTIESFPEGGLRYRLRIDPKADAKKPARLLIWLHPSGGSMDNVVEGMSPRFADDGFALLVFTQKNYNGWSSQDATALLEKTLPEVAKIEGLNAKRPVLLGFSAGGQLALQLWEQHPADFGGLILDAAYPLDARKYAAGRVEPLTLPVNDAIKSCPILAVVGGADGGAALWKRVDKPWHDGQIPLTVHIIPDKRHAWLFDHAESASLDGWLKRVAGGELPSEPLAPN